MIYNVLNFKIPLKNLEIIDFKDLQLEKEAIKTKTHKKKCYFRDNNIEIILIIWPANYATKIHSHPEGGCISKCLENKLIEKTYKVHNLEFIEEKEFNKNNISYIDNTLYYHKIENNTNKVAYSLHIYSPPNYYNKNRNIFYIKKDRV